MPTHKNGATPKALKKKLGSKRRQQALQQQTIGQIFTYVIKMPHPTPKIDPTHLGQGITTDPPPKSISDLG